MPLKHLYIHIPFCARRCAYCDFNTYANMQDRIEAYVQALCLELWLLSREYQHLLTTGHRPPTGGDRPDSFTRASLHPTIFFGGGTPSMLALDQIERVLRAANAIVPVKAAEVTLEANPGSMLGSDTAAYSYLCGLRALGINRLSLGVQSLHDPTLRILGRTHTANEAQRCFAEARRAGFDNINLDFMFGLPGQTLEQWVATLEEVTTWGADHFSLYSLILEERTPLYAQVMRGQVRVPDDDMTAAMYEAAMERFAAAGYVQYEISNWARHDPGLSDLAVEVSATAAQTLQSKIHNRESKIPLYACHHNLAYWLNSDYLAAGAGAHGHVYPHRYYDVPGVEAYIAAVQSGGRPVAEVTDLTLQDLYAETMFMGLRLNAGVSFAHFQERCGMALDAVYAPTLTEFIDLGLLERDACAVRLTPRGRMLGNQVFERFV